MPSTIAGSVLSLARESLQRVRFGLVHAEHRKKIRQPERLANAVLRLEQPKRRAESLRCLETLDELAQAVAVDVIHVGEIEKNLAIAFAQELFDERGKELVAHADGQPSLKVDDDDVTFLSGLDIHARIIYRGLICIDR